MERGEIPERLCVLHRCDNPACYRVGHLFLGTHSENMRDKVRKNRHWNQKLTPEQARLVIRRIKEGGRNPDIAAEFSVSPAFISKIRNKKRWVEAWEAEEASYVSRYEI